MKSNKLIRSIALTMLCGVGAVSNAQAYYGHGGHWHGGWGVGFGAGLATGALLTYPDGYRAYGYPYYGYVYPRYMVPTYIVPTYVDQGTVTVYDNTPVQNTATQTVQNTPNTAAPPVWYYCHSPKGYYPYVQSCPSGWQTVPATPPH